MADGRDHAATHVRSPTTDRDCRVDQQEFHEYIRPLPSRRKLPASARSSDDMPLLVVLTQELPHLPAPPASALLRLPESAGLVCSGRLRSTAYAPSPHRRHVPPSAPPGFSRMGAHSARASR